MPGVNAMPPLPLVLLVAVASLLNGCAWVSQSATLTLAPKIAESNIGNGVIVPVRVFDRRPNRVIGYRGLDSKNASITTGQDLAALFQEKILDGLQRKGFRAVPYSGQAADVLTVEVRQLDYTTDMEYWKGIIQTSCTLHTTISKNGAFFDRTYLGAYKENAVEAPGARTNERLISAAMTAAVQRFFEDDHLAAFLAN
jgi:uncharacterized lipoprotein YajG